MEYFAEYRNKQKRKDTGIISCKGMLFYETRLTYKCYCVRWCYEICIRLSNNNNKKSISKEEDYNSQESQEFDYNNYTELEEEGHKKEKGEVLTETRNQVFWKVTKFTFSLGYFLKYNW